jgi:hypothetical protein
VACISRSCYCWLQAIELATHYGGLHQLAFPSDINIQNVVKHVCKLKTLVDCAVVIKKQTMYHLFTSCCMSAHTRFLDSG